MDKKALHTVQSLLADSKQIIIIGHQNPDGDALGSSLGLYHYLRAKGHKPQVVMPNDFPEFLKWLPGADQISIFEKNPKLIAETIQNADLIFTLDFNHFSRVGAVTPILEKSKAKFIMIDHHQQPDDYAVATFSDVTKSSTCEMVFDFVKALDPDYLLSSEMAHCLFTGIMTDTGSFRYYSTSAHTLRVAAELMDAGADTSRIHQNIYDTNSPERMKLLGTALNNLFILPEFRTAFITLTQEELDAHQFKKGDTEGFVNYALSVKNVVLAAIFIENKQDKIIKISLRSKGTFSVNDMARKYFHGGGHVNAAGGRSHRTLQETIEDFKSYLPEYQKELNDEA